MAAEHAIANKVLLCLRQTVLDSLGEVLLEPLGALSSLETKRPNLEELRPKPMFF